MSEQTSARIAGPREPLPEGGTPPVIDAAFARWLADRAGQVDASFELARSPTSGITVPV